MSLFLVFSALPYEGFELQTITNLLSEAKSFGQQRSKQSEYKTWTIEEWRIDEVKEDRAWIWSKGEWHEIKL